MKKVILLIFLLFISIPAVQAAEIIGGEITYQHMGSDMYEITVTVYRDCNSPTPLSGTIKVESSTNQAITILPANQSHTTRRLENLAASCNSSKCFGGTSPYSYLAYIWKTTVNLGSFSCDAEISWEMCCRSSSITTGLDSEPFYLFATLNKCAPGGNSSPKFLYDPVFTVPHNNNFSYNPGAVDSLDSGDSLSYELTAPLRARGTSGSYTGQYSMIRPLRFLGFPNPNLNFPAGFRLNNSGTLTYRPTEAGQVAVIAIKITEWRKISGVWIEMGSTMRDMQVTVISNNFAPSLTNASLTYEVCAGEPFCLTLKTTDADTLDWTSIQLSSQFKGATVTNNNGQVKNASSTICWTPQVSDARAEPYVFYALLEDNACPVKSQNTYAILFYVKDTAVNFTVTAGPDTTINPLSTLKLRSTVSPAAGNASFWTTTGDGTFSGITATEAYYQPGPADLLSCGVKLVYHGMTPVICKTITDTVNVTFKYDRLSAGADFSSSSPKVTLSGSVPLKIAAFKQEWMALGDGTISDSSNLNANYTFGKNDLASCQAKLVLRNVDGYCNQTWDTVTIFKTASPKKTGVFSFGSPYDSVRMQGVTTENTVSKVFWTSEGDGYFADSSDLNTFYHYGPNDKKNCQVRIILKSDYTTACYGRSDTFYTKRSQAPLKAGADGNWRMNDTIQLLAPLNPDDNQEIEWTTAGDGTFSDIHDPNARYYPGPGDKKGCSVTMRLSNDVPACAQSFDEVSFFLKVTPVAAGPDINYSTSGAVELHAHSDAVAGQSFYWFTSGDGNFDNNQSLTAKYYPGTLDQKDCGTTLFLTTISSCDVYTDTLNLFQQAIPFRVDAEYDTIRIDTIKLQASPINDYMTWASNGSGIFSQSGSVYYVLSNADRSLNNLEIFAERNHCGVSQDTFRVNPSLYLNVNRAISKNDVMVYPNPTGDFLFIDSKGSTVIVAAEIYDMTGSRLISCHLAGIDNRIDLQGLPSAPYLVRITSSSGEVLSVIIQKH